MCLFASVTCKFSLIVTNRQLFELVMVCFTGQKKTTLEDLNEWTTIVLKEAQYSLMMLYIFVGSSVRASNPQGTFFTIPLFHQSLIYDVWRCFWDYRKLFYFIIWGWTVSKPDNWTTVFICVMLRSLSRSPMPCPNNMIVVKVWLKAVSDVAGRVLASLSNFALGEEHSDSLPFSCIHLSHIRCYCTYHHSKKVHHITLFLNW